MVTSARTRIAAWLRSMKSRGFIGPRYQGLSGKLRLLVQGFLIHTEIVSFADAAWWKETVSVPDGCELIHLDSFEASIPYLPALNEAYGRDLSSEWKRYFGWGQTCALLTVKDEVAAFGWLQSGDVGAKCYYLQLQPGEFRAVREGVLPGFRGQGLYPVRHQLLLSSLFARGASRVYIDAYEDNVPSWKGHKRAGYREFGRIRVFTPLGLVEYARWI